MNRPVGYYDLLDRGRLANAEIQMAATIGLARKHGTDPAFGPADMIYRPCWSTPDDWWPDPYPNAIYAPKLASHLSQFAAWYLQDLDLFADAADEVREVMAWSPDAQATIGDAYTSLGLPDAAADVAVVHVRRGDTVTRNPPRTINPLPVSYYRDAVESTGRSNVVVFSDDRDWCAAELPDGWRAMVGEPGPEDNEPDFKTRPRADWVDQGLIGELARRGAAVVMSNSVFAWWPAWMTQAEVVCVPSRWYGPVLRAKGCDETRIMLPHWQRVDVVD